MNSKNSIPDISYYRLSLVDYLYESHPELLYDETFIAARAEAAAETFRQAVLEGCNGVEAEAQAHQVLFENLYFSKHDTIKNILWNEFSDKVPEDAAKILAIRLLAECESIFSKYPLADDFAYSPEYEMLYTELTGAIAIYLESHELQ